MFIPVAELIGKSGALRAEGPVRLPPEELDRLAAKEALEIVGSPQAERASREEAGLQLDQRNLAEVQPLEEMF